MEPDDIWCDILDNNGVVQLKEVLKVGICILARQPTKQVWLHHHYQPGTELEVPVAHVDSGPNGHVRNGMDGELAE